jgi:hypothetical protein
VLYLGIELAGREGALTLTRKQYPQMSSRLEGNTCKMDACLLYSLPNRDNIYS